MKAALYSFILKGALGSIGEKDGFGLLWQSGKRVSVRVPVWLNGPGNFIILEKLDKGVMPQRAQEQRCDYV